MHILWNKTEAKCESFKPNSGFRICFWVSGSHPSFLLSQSLRFVYPSSGQRHNKKHRQWLTMPTNWASQTTPPSAIMYSCKQEEIVLALLISWSEMEKKKKKKREMHKSNYPTVVWFIFVFGSAALSQYISVWMMYKWLTALFSMFHHGAQLLKEPQRQPFTTTRTNLNMLFESRPE